ncbi:MAG: hypothetical protein ABIP20_00925 [Chthoniobacteraceae bacterium]
MIKPLIAGVAAGLVLAGAAMVMVLTVPNPESLVSSDREPQAPTARKVPPVLAAPEVAAAAIHPALSEEAYATENRLALAIRQRQSAEHETIQSSRNVTSTPSDARRYAQTGDFQRRDRTAVLGPVYFQGDREDPVHTGPILVPLAQLDPDPAIEWTEQAVAGLNALRERFAKATAVDRLDPGNPEYADRWREAQPSNDEAYRLMFGDSAFVSKQLDAARQELLLAEKH